MPAPATRFSSGVAGAAGTISTPAIEFINSHASKPAFVKRVRVSLQAATATSIGLGRPQAAGITPTTPVLLQSENGLETAQVKTAVAWATPPTVPLVFVRRGAAPAAIGNVIDFSFAEPGLRVPVGGTLVLWNITASSALDITIESDQELAAKVDS